MITANKDYEVSEFVTLVKKHGLKCKVLYPKETGKRGTDGAAGETNTKYVKVGALCVDGEWAIPTARLRRLPGAFPGAFVSIDSKAGCLVIWNFTYKYKLHLVHI